MTLSEQLIIDDFGPHVLLGLARTDPTISESAITEALHRTGDITDLCAAEMALARGWGLEA